MSVDARRRLAHGNKFPYDAPDGWWEGGTGTPPSSVDWAHAAARGVIADLKDRHTIKRGFSDVDEEIRIELVNTLAEIIREAKREEEVR